MKSIVVLGGTFDPIHNAHLELAHLLVNAFNFTSVSFIPCKQNLLKEQAPATAQERIDMIHLAIQGFPHYHCDTREIDRYTASYTIETLKSLRKDNSHDSLTFTMGMDAFNTLEQWHYFEEFLDYVHLFVFPRPGYSKDFKPAVQMLVNQHQTLHIQDLHRKKQGCIYFADKPQNSLSSTYIRSLLKHNAFSELANYLPKSVNQYIQDKKLYTQKKYL